MSKPEDAIQQFFKPEGRKGPYIHPETEKNMPNVPPLKESGLPGLTAVEVKPKSSKKQYWIFSAISALLLLTGGANYVMNTDDPSATVDGLTEDVAELFAVEVKTEPSVMEQQAAAISGIRLEIEAWERVANEAIRLFYYEPVPPGQSRTLCIKRGGETSCETRKALLDSSLN